MFSGHTVGKLLYLIVSGLVTAKNESPPRLPQTNFPKILFCSSGEIGSISMHYGLLRFLPLS